MTAQLVLAVPSDLDLTDIRKRNIRTAFISRLPFRLRVADAGRHDEALATFGAAWQALPEPKDEQEWAVNVLAAIADCSFFLGRWDDCRNAIQHAFRCGADVSNPFLRLRLGQSLYELGNLRESANWLVPVYLMEGREPFEGEDPKYLESFRSQLKPPPEGWPEGR